VIVLSTGIKELDKALGGGIIEDGILLLIYDSYSWGWLLGFEILKNRIRQGDFGLLMNYNLPVNRLGIRMDMAGIEMVREGQENNLAIIDFFGSRYGITYPYEFVYVVENFDAHTYMPKFIRVYSKITEERINGRRPVGLNFTVDGMAFEIGEETIIRLLRSNLAKKELALLRKSPEKKLPINITNVNKDRVSEKFIAWLTEMSEYVIEFSTKITESGLDETMHVIKSPLPNFEPKTYKYGIEKSKIKIEKI